ncbi:hypothetical protein HA402_011304 [Bradysia odoriphaga]|nr:hypothetical protein HA402_011304 [Bradysia odoriphaga]
MIPWLLWWFVPTIGIIFIASIHDYLYLALAGWIIAMCLDIYFFKYRKCKALTEMPKVAKDKPGLSFEFEVLYRRKIGVGFQNLNYPESKPEDSNG